MPDVKLPTIGQKIALHENFSAEKAFGAILESTFDSLRAWQPFAYQRAHIEGVHQMRVAFRRMRSALVVFRGVIPRQLTDSWAEEMRWAAYELAPARDLDVFITEALAQMAEKIPLPEGEQKLHQMASKHREEIQQQVIGLIDSERYKKLINNFHTWLQQKGWLADNLQPNVRHNMDQKITNYAQKVLTKSTHRMWQDGENIDSISPEQLHMLRISGKKLRYSTDFFGPLFPEMKKFNLQLQELQTLLGTLNDITVMQELLDKILGEDTNPDLLKYAGALIGWRAHQYQEVKKQLSLTWKEFLDSGQPWLSKKNRKKNTQLYRSFAHKKMEAAAMVQ